MYSFDFFPKKKKIELCPFQGSFMAPQGLPIFKNSAFKHIFQKKKKEILETQWTWKLWVNV